MDFVGLSNAHLPIVYLDGPTLGRSFMMHAVVVAETEQSVKVLDPSKGLVELDRALFCDAWDIAGNYAVLIKPMQSIAE